MTRHYDNQDLTPRRRPVKLERASCVNTTVGRAILNDALPKKMPYVNGLLKKKGMGQLINYCYLNLGLEVTVKTLDRIKDLGFRYATRSGLSVGLDDMVIPDFQVHRRPRRRKAGARHAAPVPRRSHKQR